MDVQCISTDFWTTYVQVMMAFFWGLISPGADFFIILRNSLAYGRRPGIWTALGTSGGLLLYVVVGIVGMSYLFHEYPITQDILRYGGASFLAYLGIKTLFHARATSLKDMGAQSADTISSGAAFWTGFLTHMLNPQAMLVIFGFFARAMCSHPTEVEKWWYGIGMMIAATAWFVLVAFIFTSPKVQTYFARWSIWLERLAGIMLIYVAWGFF